MVASMEHTPGRPRPWLAALLSCLTPGLGHLYAGRLGAALAIGAAWLVAHLLGDYRDHSADSRVYGPVPVDSVIGTVRYVYFSNGPAGVRWRRLGQRVE